VAKDARTRRHLRSDLHNGGLAYMRMIRTDEWKVVRYHFTSSLDELYDLGTIGWAGIVEN
jgi:hypothetical protein